MSMKYFSSSPPIAPLSEPTLTGSGPGKNRAGSGNPRRLLGGILEKKRPRFAVWGGWMNLQEQVEPLCYAAIEASSQRRHAQQATSRFAWVKRWLNEASEPSRAKQKRPDPSPGRGDRQGHSSGQAQVNSEADVERRNRCATAPLRVQCRVEHLFDGAGPIDDRLARSPADSRHRNISSAMLSAARTARRSVSWAVPLSAAAFIFSSTYAASSAMYAGSSALRIGYRWPWMKTGTTRSEGSDTFQGCRLQAAGSSGRLPRQPAGPQARRDP